MARSERLIERILAVLSRREEGMRQAHLAKELQEHPQAIARALAGRNKTGVLLQEDDKGRISLMRE